MLQFSRSSCLIGDERWKCEEKGLIDIYQFNSNLFIHFNGGSYRWTHHQSSSTPLSYKNRADIQVKSHSNKHTPKGSAICVQRFNDSQTSAVRITYRSSLRSSSIQEPRYPSWRVIKPTQNQFNHSISILISYARQQFKATHSNKNSHEWSFRRFTYGNLVTTSPSSRW